MTQRIPLEALDPNGAADGDYSVTVADGLVTGLALPTASPTRSEVVVYTIPAEAVTTGDGSDWLYVEVPA